VFDYQWDPLDRRPAVSIPERVGATRSQLDAHPYELGADEFVRVRADDNDNVVAGVVRAVTSEGEAGCNEFRHGLETEEIDTLRLFALRRTLLGRRQSSSSAMYEAMDCYALLPRIDDVPWESWLKAALFIARSLGGDLDMIGRRFRDVADEIVNERFEIALKAMDRVRELSQCRIAEVATTYGVGFVEMMVFHDSRRGGFSSPPHLGDNRVIFAPSTNLAQLAVNVADSLDATEKVTTGPISQDQLAATLFSVTTAGSYLTIEGCLSFVASGNDDGPSFTVFVAELPEDADIESLADDATDTDNQAAIYEGQRLIVLSPQPSFDEDVDIEVDFNNYEDLVLQALNDPATH
jgi:hypothetical protein